MSRTSMTNRILYADEEIKNLIIQSAKEDNIVPIISKCDAGCIFCSHKNNPPDIQVVSVGVRSLEDICQTLDDLNKDQAITIGESASNIIEGEPLLHPDFMAVMTLIRRNFPDTPIAVTTNGRYLTKAIIDSLCRLKGITINLSMNSSSIEGRMKLMNDTKEQALTAIKSVRYMHESGMNFSASMVGMPNITGFSDIKNTIMYLAENGAESVRIFMPGFSAFVKEDIFPDGESIHRQLKTFIEALSVEIPCPILLEPSYVTDLLPVVSGVLHNSPAWLAGIRRGDIIASVNGQKPLSRVDAWNLLDGSGKRLVSYKRQGRILNATWENTSFGSSGIVMEYDYDMRQVSYLKQVMTSAPGKVLSLTSEFAYHVICQAYEQLNIRKEHCEVFMVKNHTFGGTIRAAGLLTVDDYVDAYKEYCESNEEPAAIIVPQISFNYLGKDLKGRHFEELKKRIGKPVAVI